MDYEKMIEIAKVALDDAQVDLENQRQWYCFRLNTKGKARANLEISEKQFKVKQAKANLAAIMRTVPDRTGVRHLTLKSGIEHLATIEIDLDTAKFRFLNVNSEVSMFSKVITFKNLPEKELTIEL